MIWIDEMRFLLDTNILIALSKQRPGLSERLEGIAADAVLLSSVVARRRGISKANAVVLGAYFGVSASVFLD